MPELPEVETIKRELAPHLKGEIIREVVIRRKEIVGFPKIQLFKQKVIGKRIKEVERRGKYLILRLSDGSRLIFHLKLSGRLFLIDGEESPKHERIRFLLNQRNLSFVEPRMFGRVFLVEGEVPRVLKGWQELGPEPLSRAFNQSFLGEKLRGRKGKIKSLLLDQRIGCGIGNIYADESLFLARINPERTGGSLTQEEIARLVRAIKKVLRKAIRHKGTTLSDYFRPDGKEGGFQSLLRVKDREGEPCLVCGELIQKIRIGNRSTHLCPRCQR